MGIPIRRLKIKKNGKKILKYTHLKNYLLITSLHLIGGFLNSPLVLRYLTINGTDVAVIPILTGANTEVDR